MRDSLGAPATPSVAREGVARAQPWRKAGAALFQRLQLFFDGGEITSPVHAGIYVLPCVIASRMAACQRRADRARMNSTNAVQVSRDVAQREWLGPSSQATGPTSATTASAPAFGGIGAHANPIGFYAGSSREMALIANSAPSRKFQIYV